MANELVPLLSLSEAKALVTHLENNEVNAANEIIESASNIKNNEDNGMFSQVGELTRELHDALVSFQSDTRLIDMTGHDLPDAKDRLNYVIEMTDNAANKTMDAVDTCLPVADKLIADLESVMPNWQKLMGRDLPLNEFKELCHQLDNMLLESNKSALTLRTSLTDILMAQDFQDLTGQMIRRVISLVQEIESKLVGILTVCHDGNLEEKISDDKNNVKQSIEAEGPIMHAEERDDVVNGQDDVDDLLSSLGF
ncbi:protein phosphatase CheZ [Psychromonas sp. PT13]|uniref:protein phosphatase CheZ n=1 Tax=Psychromonas sp. PT13 TaxID=3439547 RepID=UPI003EC018A9